MKASVVSHAIRKKFKEILIHTGQHFDLNMSEIFFHELGIPKPEVNLGIAGGSHGAQTGQMLLGLEKLMLDYKPDMVLVYGDTNSTLAGALAAVKINIPIIHIEAGLRSYRKDMPEEINRLLTDQISDYLFVPSDKSKDNLKREGISKGVFVVGDVMVDAVRVFSKVADEKSNILKNLDLIDKDYCLLTIHRAENTDNREMLSAILHELGSLKGLLIWPIHPRTKIKLKEFELKLPENIKTIDPVGYLNVLELISSAQLILTDSGGIQKEAYCLKTPCITLRNETEWEETLSFGWNQLCPFPFKTLSREYEKAKNAERETHKNVYGDGFASERIANILFDL